MTEQVWRLVVSKTATKQLGRLDKPVARMILAWLEKNVDGTSNPRAHGKALTANRAGQWRYRVGAYRVLCEIYDDSLVVLAVSVGHRREIYRD